MGELFDRIYNTWCIVDCWLATTKAAGGWGDAWRFSGTVHALLVDTAEVADTVRRGQGMLCFCPRFDDSCLHTIENCGNLSSA